MKIVIRNVAVNIYELCMNFTDNIDILLVEDNPADDEHEKIADTKINKRPHLYKRGPTRVRIVLNHKNEMVNV